MADACGGTFCDGGNPSMTVEQTGETILFVFDGDFVEAHVQIEYDGGDASQFAWIVPLPRVPEVEVGSARLINNSLTATVPVYGYSTTNTCDTDPTGVSGFITSADGGSSSEEPPPRVVAKNVVGAFEYVVLQGGTADTVNDWLQTEGYAANPTAPDIISEYLDEGMLFLAFKLRHFAGTEDIHPVVIRYQGNEPCVPLRLTRIAAEDDMPIRVLFLGDERALPTNYKHVLLNRTRLDWIGVGANYDELVTRAIDEAGGRAFVTEYAGASNTIDTENLDTTNLDGSVFETMEVTGVVDQLVAYDLMSCGRTCSYDHELVPSLLSEFVPAPDGIDPTVFYACLDCYPALIDDAAWDGPAFAQAFQERVVDPLDHAAEMLATWPYITRLYTRISPEEMISDPMFAEVPDLPDVPNRIGAQREFDCCGTVWTMPGGRRIRTDGQGTPGLGPWAERIEEWNPSGPPMMEFNGSEMIDDLIAEHNAQFDCSLGGTTGTGGSEDDGPGPSDAGNEGPNGTTFPPDEGTSGSSSGGLDDGASSCACRGGGSSSGWLFALLGLAFWRRRGI